MSLKTGIQRFLDDVDPKILARGEDYYRSGQVENVERDGGHVTAEVFGCEEKPYLVELDVSEDGEVEGWSCDCPYDWGPVCKHTAAVLLAIQAEAGKEKRLKAKKTQKVSIQELVVRANKEQLASLILEHCREDKRFQSLVLSELEDSGEQEFDAIKELVRVSIRSNTHQHYIDERGCDNICADLDDCLDKATRRIERKQYSQALEIIQFVLVTGMKLASEADSSSGSLSYTIDSAMGILEQAARGLVQSGGNRNVWVKKLLKTAMDPVFEGWDDSRYDLLQRSAILADTQNEGEFYAVLDKLSEKRWERFEDSPWTERWDKLTRYHVLCAAHGQKDARGYLEKNLDVDELRLILVQEEMEHGNYANAERLCRERVEREAQEKRTMWSRPSQWQLLLYDIYRDWGQRDKQIGQARVLAALGEQRFYQTAKDLLTEGGRWQEEYPKFREELKASLPVYTYMEILKGDGETDLLMEQVRLQPDTVFQYGDVLAPQYGDEVFGLCSSEIREASKGISNRKHYQRLCELLRSLIKFGGSRYAQILINELYEAYPRRPALLEELERVERGI